MMEEATGPSRELRRARRAVDAFPEMNLISDLRWFPTASSWGICIEVALPSGASGELPDRSRWWVVMDHDYPWGAIDVYPAVEGGTDKTFYHQLHNGPPSRDQLPWRSGKLCFWSPNFIFGRAAFVDEPFGHEARMEWVLRQFLEWVRRAAAGSLVSPGDPFELPDFPSSRRTLVAFSESLESLRTWTSVTDSFGVADLCQVAEHALVIREFLAPGGRQVLKPHWGPVIRDARRCPHAVWIILPAVPVLPVYGAPGTWGEFREAARLVGCNLDGLLLRALNQVRDGHEHLATIGFAVPSAFGTDSPPCVMHWQALLLPPLAAGKNYRRGFRANAEGYWAQDRYANFRDTDKVEWVKSRNWHQSQLGGRGEVAPELAASRVTVIGVGALGSVIAELLARGGVRDLVLLDPDSVEAGNLVRHVLSMDAVGKPKATAVAEMLNQTLPHMCATGIDARFPAGLSGRDRQLVRESQVILDCSAADGVLRILGNWDWSENPTLLSLSVGYGAERLYALAGHGGDFLEAMLRSFGGELRPDRAALEAADLPAEAIGCWHPLFPARVDRVWGLAAVAVALIEECLTADLSQIQAWLYHWNGGRIERARR